MSWELAVCIGCVLSMRALAQGLVEELKKLRAAEESTVALVDEEMTARFSGDVTLTVCDAPIVLSPHQVRPGSPRPLAARNAPIVLSLHQMLPGCCQPLACLSHLAWAWQQTVSGSILTATRHSPHGRKVLHDHTFRPYT